MSDSLFERFLDECQEISNGLRDLGSEWPKNHDDAIFNRHPVSECQNYSLYRYRSHDHKVNRSKKEPEIVLIVYSLINRATIIEFQNNKSLVGDLLESNCDVFLLDWKEFNAGIDNLSLADYPFRFIEECVNEIQRITNVEAINMVGLCQGGVFSLLYALKHKNNVRRLALMSTPIDFKTQKDTMSKILQHIDLELLRIAPFVSGSMLNSFFNMLAPYSILQKKYLTLLERQSDPEFVRSFLLMENWRWDCPNVSGKVLAEFIDIFYFNNSFLNRTIELSGIRIELGEKIGIPVLNLYGTRDRLVPPDSSKALSRMVAPNCAYQERSFECGHIGMYTYRKEGRSSGRTIAKWFCLKNGE